MTQEEAIYYLKSSGMSDEQIKSVIDAFTCEDCISREEAIRIAEQGQIQGYEWQFKELCNLPPVIPQPKTGHWIMTNYYYTGAYGTIDYVECSCCGEESLEEGDYCPNCGVKMEVEG